MSDAVPTIDMEGAKFGAINAMRTGNPLYDMMIAMMIPLIFKLIFDGAQHLKPLIEQIQRYFAKAPEAFFERIIQIEQKVTSWGWTFSDSKDRNTVLVKAVTLYLAAQNISFKQAQVNLTSMVETGHHDSDSDDDGEDGRSELGQLKKNYRLTRAAPLETWVQVEPNIFYYKEVKEENGGGGGQGSDSHKKLTTMIKINAPTEKQVDEFIDKVYQWYLDELKGMQDNSRYMYEMVAASKSASAEGGSNGEQAKRYRRYKLSDEKTFVSIFFPEKEALMQLIKHFQERTGKYAIPGYPHKLGLLLHGPPGTGKTSMIKALAHHTQRSIVNVPLARLDTNSELMEVMFDQRYHIVGQEVPIKLGFKDVIFVMEDVDAISKIVHRRDGGAASSAAPAGKGDKQVTTTLEVGKSGDGEVQATLTKTTSVQPPDADAPAPAAEAPKAPKAAEGSAKAAAPSGTADGDDSEALVKAVQAMTAGPLKSGETSSLWETKDKLNLSGILNVLDGVVDSPNRLLVMTTNHPEKLDPALIRPGRIDKKFHLTYLCGAQAVKMAAHYFQSELSAEESTRISELIDGSGPSPGLELTPARLEQFCAEHETVPELCAALQALRTPRTSSLKLQRVASVRVEDALAPATERPVKYW
mmetsp:Transcript_14742/g.46374  ORF Transcript_14742/g.46374 Transcript_14742/m.46374 type:complete len:641 (-) Transcript_14742:41-1963(-)